jgi:hypothetical protein
MYGRDPEMLLQSGVRGRENEEHPGNQWYVGLLKARATVREYIARAALSNKEAYDRVVRPQEFRVGDAVLIYRKPPSNTKGPRKLMPKYVGPYRIEEVTGKVAKVRPIREPGIPQGQLTTVIFDHMRHCDADRVMLYPPERRTDPAGVDPNLEEESEEW